MKIIYWSDYACPYCYIGETRLKKAVREMGLENEVEFEARAFELDPEAPTTVQTTTDIRFAKKYQLSLEGARAKIEQISNLGREEGIDFRYATTLYTNTCDAHRLTKLAQSKNVPALADKVSELLFDAYFTRNEKLADRDVLLRVAKDAGMDAEEVNSMLDSDRFIDDVRYDEREAMLRGVRGVPYFVIDDLVSIPGAISVRAMKGVLNRAIEAKAKPAEEEHPHQCGPDGCRI
mgnify:CR=1 FL=1